LKDTLAAFDLDTPELVKSGNALERWARDEGLPVLVVSSGREGHRHLYIRCDYHGGVDGKAQSFGIPKSAHRRSIRPPLAPHRKDLPTALLDPSTLDDALEVLGPSEQDEPRYKNLPEWLITLINDGDTANRYGGRSQMALAIASGLRGAGYDFGAYRAVMANRTNSGGAKYHALEDGEGTENPETFLSRTWEKASNQLTPTDILTEIVRVREAVAAVDWPTRTGNTDRSVMLALCELGTASGTTALTFGSRNIASVAQLEDRTVRRALGRLVVAGWLERVKASQAGDADTYRFGPMVDKMTALSPSPHSGDRCGTYDQVDSDAGRLLLHPAFRNGSGLGKNAGRTWLSLRGLGSPVTATELAKTRRAGRRTVDRHLKSLAENGLAIKVGTDWTAVGDDLTLDELAVRLGAIERSELQSERYKRNREGFRALRVNANRQVSEPEVAGALVSDTSMEDAERRRWEEDQELFKLMGLPHHLG
jgi:predicted transcriptional regulator